jgi:diacylglycerol kinase
MDAVAWSWGEWLDKGGLVLAIGVLIFLLVSLWTLYATSQRGYLTALTSTVTALEKLSTAIASCAENIKDNGHAIDDVAKDVSKLVIRSEGRANG